jgi:hypothetical protein
LVVVVRACRVRAYSQILNIKKDRFSVASIRDARSAVYSPLTKEKNE